MRTEARIVCMPVSALMVAPPPRMSMDVTMRFAEKPKKRNVLCASGQRALTISHMVCAVGHLRLISMARMPKRSTWIVAPEAYQKGPEMP